MAVSQAVEMKQGVGNNGKCRIFEVFNKRRSSLNKELPTTDTSYGFLPHALITLWMNPPINISPDFAVFEKVSNIPHPIPKMVEVIQKIIAYLNYQPVHFSVWKNISHEQRGVINRGEIVLKELSRINAQDPTKTQEFRDAVDWSKDIVKILQKRKTQILKGKPTNARKILWIDKLEALINQAQLIANQRID
jgi:hypothetical protein